MVAMPTEVGRMTPRRCMADETVGEASALSKLGPMNVGRAANPPEKTLGPAY